MHQRLFILSVAALLWLGLPLPGFADAYRDGVSAYKAGYYAKSIPLLKSAVNASKNPDAVFYLGMAYARANQYANARQAFDLVVQMVPPEHPLAAKARNNISYLTKQQITQVSNSGRAAQVMTAALSPKSVDNYLPNVIYNGKVVHFALSRPLRVYIADGKGVEGWNNNLKQVVTYAMRTWQSAMRSKVSFSQTYNEANADIIVRWKQNFSDNILGVSPFQMVGSTIVRSDIFLAVYYPDSKRPIPLEELKSIAVHEFGHALGMHGHSPYPSDIMYFSKTRRLNTPSTRDINTMRLLYQLNADVQNIAGISTVAAKKYYDLYALGLKAQNDNRLNEAIAYYRQAIGVNGQLPEAKFNLGALLINEGNLLWRKGQLEAAKRNMEEATRLYTEVLNTPKPPPGSRDNLEIAQANLQNIRQSLQR